MQKVEPTTGLSETEAQERLQQYGPNAFAEAKKESGRVAFLHQYEDPMQIVLLVAGVVSGVLIRQWGTAIVLLGLTLFNAIIGLHQEGKAEASVAALQKMMILKVRVRRGGQAIEVASEKIVLRQRRSRSAPGTSSLWPRRRTSRISLSRPSASNLTLRMSAWERKVCA
jgi:Ca2+-transporting ATPase